MSEGRRRQKKRTWGVRGVVYIHGVRVILPSCVGFVHLPPPFLPKPFGCGFVQSVELYRGRVQLLSGKG